MHDSTQWRLQGLFGSSVHPAKAPRNCRLCLPGRSAWIYRWSDTLYYWKGIKVLTYTASGCIIFASNILVATGQTATEWEKRGIALAVISFVTIVHTFFPRLGVRGMNFIGLIKIFTLLFIVITGWAVLSGGVSKVEDPYASFRDPFAGSATSGNLYATAFFKVLNSYAG